MSHVHVVPARNISSAVEETKSSEKTKRKNCLQERIENSCRQLFLQRIASG